MNVITISEDAFFELLERSVERLRDQLGEPAPKWLGTEEAMAMLKIKSKTTLQVLRDGGKIRYTQPQKKIILYDRESILEYLEAHARNTF